jgi:hypothetical protein
MVDEGEEVGNDKEEEDVSLFFCSEFPDFIKKKSNSFTKEGAEWTQFY